jgi:hypothetical protein
MSDLTILKESATCRVAISHSAEGEAVEVLLRVMPPGEVDIQALDGIVALIKCLHGEGFRLSFQDEGWLSGEKACPGPSDGSAQDVLAMLDRAGLS